MTRWWRNYVDTDYLVIGGLLGGGVFILFTVVFGGMMLIPSGGTAPPLWAAPLIALSMAFVVFLASVLIALGNAIWESYQSRTHTTYGR